MRSKVLKIWDLSGSCLTWPNDKTWAHSSLVLKSNKTSVLSLDYSGSIHKFNLDEDLLTDSKAASCTYAAACACHWHSSAAGRRDNRVACSFSSGRWSVWTMHNEPLQGRQQHRDTRVLEIWGTLPALFNNLKLVTSENLKKSTCEKCTNKCIHAWTRADDKLKTVSAKLKDLHFSSLHWFTLWRLFSTVERKTSTTFPGM